MLLGAVAFLDVLGFKGIWQRYADDPGRVLRKLESLEASIQGAAKKFIDGALEEGMIPERVPRIRVMFISDSVFITCGDADDRPENLVTGILCVTFLAATTMLFGMNGDVPLVYRGAISTGKFLAADDKPFVVGPAIDDAAGVENLAQGAFVWLTPSACEAFETRKRKDVEPPSWMRYHEVPLKGLGNYGTWVVDPLATETLPEKAKDAYVGRLFKSMTANSLDVIIKRDNTIAFYEDLLSRERTDDSASAPPATDADEKAPDGEG